MRNEALKNLPLLALLPPRALADLLNHSSVETYRKGSNLFHEGDACENVYRIISGRCETYQTLGDGTLKHLAILGPGDYLGEPDFSGQRHHDTSARVITDSVLQRIPCADLRSLLAGNGILVEAPEKNISAAELVEDHPVSHSGRIVVGFSFSPNLPNRLMIDKLAQSLFSETGESVLVLRIISARQNSSSRSCAALDEIIDSDFHFRAALPKANGSVARMTLKITGKSREAEHVAPLLGNLSRHFDYVLVEADTEDFSLAPLLEFVIQADASYLFIHPASEDLRSFDSFLATLRARAHGNCSDINPVICLAPNERFDDRVKLNNGCAHAFVHDCPVAPADGFALAVEAPAFTRDIRHLAREIGHCRIGLALSAGGAKGLAHIGVIQVLEENGIEVDIIAGSSMGAYVASVWAMGCDGQKMEQLAREVQGRWGLWKLVDPAFPPRKGFMRGEAVIRRLKNTLGDAHFSDLVRPLRIVATDLNTLDRVIFCGGEVTKAVHASCAIPGVCVPVEIDGETYIDGGVAEPLPVDVLSEMGVHKIIAVNALPPSAFLRCCREKQKEQAEILRKQPGALNLVNRQVNFFANGNILDILMSAVHGSQIRVAEQAGRKASVVLRPLAMDGQWHDFNHPGKYIELGRQVALQHLDELKALVQKPISRHENQRVKNPMAAVA
ncbi:MAG TPA: patatin-like phospholipase family protein [Candidatus Polarisedimenticolia bacterium]|nr:patatin-like phospholipase family protein [Candidatus Polarisedimenticolia bacterium]